MEKRVLLGVQNKSNPFKKKTKSFLKKVVGYMKSDSYMFAPLISTPHADFLPSKTSNSSTAAVEMKEGMKVRNKRLLEKVEDYLKSDTYMFAPLCDQPVVSLKGHASYIKNITMEVSTRKLTRKDNQSTVETSNVTVEDQFSELPGKSMSDQQKFVHKETVKCMVYQSCRSSLSGKAERECMTHGYKSSLLTERSQSMA